ncbi:MAG: hypothetical protein IKK85_09615 [Clostridia bacterium]|nr:hypothetical protein [Clostridia bacterium]
MLPLSGSCGKWEFALPIGEYMKGEHIPMEIFQKIFSAIMAFFLSLFGMTPALEPVDAYTQAEWYAKLNNEFQLTYDLEDGDNLAETVDSTDELALALEACYDSNVIVGEYDADAKVTDILVAKSLAAAAWLEGDDGKIVTDADSSNALDVAIKVCGFEISVNVITKEPKETVISKQLADAWLAAAKQASKDQMQDTDNGGNLATKDQDDVDLQSLALVENADGLTLQTADGKVIDEEDIVELDYEGSVNPFAQPEAAGINNQSILDDIEVSFDVGDMHVEAGIADGGFDVALSGNINGVGITKKYEVRDFNVATKFEGNLSVNDVKQSYILLDYNLDDITTVTSSKAWSLAETELPEGSDDVDFFARVQNNLFEMREGADAEINVFSVDVAIPNCPAITIGITAKLVITFDGRVDLVIHSSETKGVRIVNNEVRLVNETEGKTWECTMQARVEAVLGLYVDISIVSIILVDAGIEVGLGVHVTVYMTGGTDEYTLDIPYDFLMDINFVFPNSDNLTATINVKVYGIVKASVGQNSPILDKLGLSESWTLVYEDLNGGTFINETFSYSKAA